MDCDCAKNWTVNALGLGLTGVLVGAVVEREWIIEAWPLTERLHALFGAEAPARRRAGVRIPGR